MEEKKTITEKDYKDMFEVAVNSKNKIEQLEKDKEVRRNLYREECEKNGKLEEEILRLECKLNKLYTDYENLSNCNVALLQKLNS